MNMCNTCLPALQVKAQAHPQYKYYVFGHYPVSSLSKNRPVYFSEHNVSETGFCLCHQVKPTQLDPIDRAGPYLRTPEPAPRWGI
jgi:hypothetical protein